VASLSFSVICRDLMYFFGNTVALVLQIIVAAVFLYLLVHKTLVGGSVTVLCTPTPLSAHVLFQKSTHPPAFMSVRLPAPTALTCLPDSACRPLARTAAANPGTGTRWLCGHCGRCCWFRVLYSLPDCAATSSTSRATCWKEH